jgi:hypothetical protein
MDIKHERQRAAFDADSLLESIEAMLHETWSSVPTIVAEDSDGFTAKLQPSIKMKITHPDGTTEIVTLPQLADAPVHFTGGGGLTATHPVKKGDEGIAQIVTQPQDSWFQQGGVQDPIDGRHHHLSDSRYIPGGRSIPRKLPNVSTTEHHTRSDDAKTTHAVGLTKITHKVVPASDPSTDPYNSAQTFFQTLHDQILGVIRSAVSPGVQHSDTIDHSGITHSIQNALHTLKLNLSGIIHSVQNALHTTSMTPGGGIVHSAFSGQSVVSVAQTLALSSTTGISLSSPSLSLPSGGVSSSALASGAASSNVGALGGDLAGSLPGPQVVGCRHIADANLLGVYANDAAAEAGGVVKGGLYLWSGNTPNLLAVRTV